MSRPPLKYRNSKPGLIGIGQIPDQSPVASFNIEGVNNLIDTKSIEAIHYVHAPLPTGGATIGAPVNPNTQGAQRGVIYYSARKLGVVPQQFKIEDRLTVQGIWGVGSVLFNVTGHYWDGGKEQVHIRNRDLIVIPTVTDMVDERVEYKVSSNLKLNYLVRGVDYLTDGKFSYQEGYDFVIENFVIKWVDGGVKPAIGSVLSCVYWMTPIYIIQNKLHSLRIIPSNSFGSGAFPRDSVYAPQLVIAKPSTIVEENDLMDWTALPNYNDYGDDK